MENQENKEVFLKYFEAESIRINNELKLINENIIKDLNQLKALNQRIVMSKKDRIKQFLFMVIACVLITSTLFLPKPVHASDQYGVNFDIIEWSNLCPKVEPVSLDYCPIVHPTSKTILKRTSGFEGVSGEKQTKLDCEYLEKRYTQLLSAPPRKCKHYFKSAFKSLVVFGNAPLFTAEEFRDRYLSEGITNLNGIKETRQLLGR